MLRLPYPGFRSAVAFGAILSATWLSAQPLPAKSPFLPPGENRAAGTDGAKYQLGGMLIKGKEVLLSITRVSDKRSFWIPVGGTVEEVTAVSYIPESEQAVISANGERFTLKLRQGATAAGGGSALASSSVAITPPLPAPVGPPEVQEREARMLVTDLLEIGQAHRKAYEEAQKKAATEAGQKRP